MRLVQKFVGTALVALVALLALALPVMSAYNPTSNVTAGVYTVARTTMSGTLVLTNTSASSQVLNPNGATRTVTLPTSPTTGLYFNLTNTSSANKIVVRDSSAVLVLVLPPLGTATVTYDSTAWQSPQIPAPRFPIFWFKANAGTWQNSGLSTPAVADGDLVGGWADQSTNGLNATQSNNALRATLKTNIVNGLPVVRFPGSNTTIVLNTASQWINSDVSFTVVVSRPWTTDRIGAVFAASDIAAFLGGPDLSSETAAFDWPAKSLSAFGNGYQYASPRANGAYGAIAANTFHVITATIGSRSNLWLDGVSISASQGNGPCDTRLTSGNTNPLHPTFNIGNDVFNEGWDGDMGDLLLVNSLYTEWERLYFDQLLADKYGLTIT